MEYTSIIQPIFVIFISFSAGIFFGSLWMFYIMYNTQTTLKKELDSKNNLLDSYMHIYEDDNPDPRFQSRIYE